MIYIHIEPHVINKSLIKPLLICVVVLRHPFCHSPCTSPHPKSSLTFSQGLFSFSPLIPFPLSLSSTLSPSLEDSCSELALFGVGFLFLLLASSLIYPSLIFSYSCFFPGSYLKLLGFVSLLLGVLFV